MKMLCVHCFAACRGADAQRQTEHLMERTDSCIWRPNL